MHFIHVTQIVFFNLVRLESLLGFLTKNEDTTITKPAEIGTPPKITDSNVPNYKILGTEKSVYHLNFA